MVSSKQPKLQSSGFTKEEELLLQDYSRNISTKSSALFYGNALIISMIPIWLFWRLHNMESMKSIVIYVVITALSTYLMSIAYKNTKFQLKHKISSRRAEAIAREINREVTDDKKVSRKEKEERILWKKNEVAEYEATTFSIFYNNILFLTITVFVSFFLLKNSSSVVNYTFSLGLASGVLALFSTNNK